MRKAVFLLCLIAISYPVGASALVGISIGGKIGYSDYSGDIFPGSGDLGTGTGYGLILGFGAVPVVDFQIRASYFLKDFDYSYDVGGNQYDTSFEYRDVALTAVLTKSVFAPPGSPFNVYVGGGIGYHVINTEIALAAAAGSISPSDADNPFVLMQNTGKASGEGIVGLKIGAPAFPFSAFGEFSYGLIFASERLTVTQFSAGVLLGF
jgi:hypothetical protein